MCVCVCPCINNACQYSVCAHSGELRATDWARPRAKQGPDWSEGPYRAPGGPLMELSLCHVLAVQQPPLLSHTHTHITYRSHTHAQCLQVLMTQQFLLSWSQYQREFKGTTVLDRRNTVITAGCKNRVMFKGKRSCLDFPSCVQCFDLRNLKGSWKAALQRRLQSQKKNTLEGWDFFASVTQVRSSILFCASETAFYEEHLNWSSILTGCFHRRKRTGGWEIKCTDLSDFLGRCFIWR